MGGAAFAVSVGVAGLDLSSFEQYVWFSFVRCSGHGSGGTYGRRVSSFLVGLPVAVVTSMPSVLPSGPTGTENVCTFVVPGEHR